MNKKLDNTEDIFLILKAWIDPLENRDAFGYEYHSYTKSEEEAKTFCKSQGYWTTKDCWALSFVKDKKMPKYKYKKLGTLSSQ